MVFEVIILADGQTITFRASNITPKEILAEANIPLSSLDYTIPALDAPISETNTIQVVRVREETIVEETEIPFQTVWQGTDTLDLDTQALISSGQVGLFQRQIKIRYEEGVEIEQIGCYRRRRSRAN